LAAASLIHDHYMPNWAESDRTLNRLHERLPGFDVDAVLAKAALVNQLYFARHDRLIEAAKQISRVMAAPPADPIAIVEAIAPLDREGKTWWYWSFASKFGQFFISPEIPIYDEFAVQALRHHFGRLTWTDGSPYRSFAGYVLRLRGQVGVE
jgi:hypothetical protein